MKLIDCEAHLITEVNPLKKIEMAGRTCYKSEKNITDDSAEAFVKSLANNKHYAMLEHAVFSFVVSGDAVSAVDDLEQFPYFIIDQPWVNALAVTANLRAIHENEHILADECKAAIAREYPKIAEILGWEVRPLTNAKVEDPDTFPESIKLRHKHVTFRFICDRGVTHELVRHRPVSFAQESTRYVAQSSYKPLLEYNCNVEEDIIKAYEQGFSMRAISLNSDFTEWEIRKILLANNVKPRSLNNKGKRADDYFDVIDTPEKAYLLGIIQTDGSIESSENGKFFTITQHKDYMWYIDLMLHEFSEYVCKYDDSNCYQVMIGSSHMVDTLISYGIVPNKSKIQTDENIDTLWNTIPEEYKGDFIRGLFDGDGSVAFKVQKGAHNPSPNISFCSTSEHLVDILQEFLETKFGYKCGKYHQDNIWNLGISKLSSSIEIGKYLFTNFKYPFGHPKKSANWIRQINQSYPVANFGDSSFQIIEPSWFREGKPEQIFHFVRSFAESEKAYKESRLMNLQPQQARALLPNAIKSEIIMTTSCTEWNHIFNLRYYGTTGKPHPDMLELMTKAFPLYQSILKV